MNKIQDKKETDAKKTMLAKNKFWEVSDNSSFKKAWDAYHSRSDLPTLFEYYVLHKITPPKKNKKASVKKSGGKKKSEPKMVSITCDYNLFGNLASSFS